MAALVGVVAGIGVAGALKGLLAAFGLAIPAGDVVFTFRTVWISVLVGVVVTVAAALPPSYRASSIAPMVAIRSASVEDADGYRRRLVAGGGLLIAGVAVLFWGMFGNPGNRVGPIGLGAVAVFLGVAALGPIIAAPFASFVGRPISRFGGVPGELARENAVRNPKRTATTAAALMIGVGLVGAITIFAESAKASINKIIDDAFVGDLVIDSGNFGFGGISPELSLRLNELPEVRAASGVRLGFAEIDGTTRTLFGVDPATMGDIVDVGVLTGSVASLDANDLAVHEDFAEDRGWVMGDKVEVKFPATGIQEFEVALVYERDELTGNFFIGNPAFEANYPEVFDFQVYVLRDPGSTPEEARLAVEAAAADFANAEVQDLQEFKQAQADQINQLLGLVYALLALAILIALIGIANTLALSVIERTRELGLLRAVGMTRLQLRRSIRYESVLIAMLGAVLGAVIGVFFGWAIVAALADEGITELRIPLVQMAVVIVVAVMAGVVAAIGPARRAARKPVLEAIAPK